MSEVKKDVALARLIVGNDHEALRAGREVELRSNDQVIQVLSQDGTPLGEIEEKIENVGKYKARIQTVRKNEAGVAAVVIRLRCDQLGGAGERIVNRRGTLNYNYNVIVV